MRPINATVMNYVIMNRLKSLMVWLWLKRPDKRLPSAKRIWIEVVGWLASTFSSSLALHTRIKSEKSKFNFDRTENKFRENVPFFVRFIVTSWARWYRHSWRAVFVLHIWRWTAKNIRMLQVARAAIERRRTNLPRVCPLPANGLTFVADCLKSSFRWSSMFTVTMLPPCWRNSGGNWL